jgi:hypothetical protein
MSAMTSSTAARTGPEREPGTLPRLGMMWVIWRQHRAALAGVAVLLASLSLVLLISGLKIRDTYASLGIASCHGASQCQALRSLFADDYFGEALYAPRFLEFMPGLIGAFLGAPLLAREFEAGTYRFAWTQGAGRMRWVAGKVAALALAGTALALAFSQVFAWWYRPFEPSIARMISGQAFEVEGVVFAARTLLAFTLGVAAGAIIRRVVPALAATLAGWLAVAWPTVAFLRPHFQAPLTVAVTAGGKLADWGSTWTLGDWWVGPDGKRVSHSAMTTLVRQLSSRNIDTNTWLIRHHYVQWESYQPGSRFWEFQAIECAGLVTLSLALAAAALYWVHRRAA